MKVDLHTHSIDSPDGGLTPEDYTNLFANGTFDCLAITDHNTIKLAHSLHTTLGDKVIVGEEISTSEGELIGLFLSRVIAPEQTARATAEAIKAQGGLVYIPHPFETVRAGLGSDSLQGIADLVDIVEVHNGRALFQNRGPTAATWARLHHKVMAASSDAHGRKGIGTTYQTLHELPTSRNLVALLSTGRLVTNRPPLRSLFYPKLHRLRRRLGRQS